MEDLLNEAIAFALRVHAGQKRKSGVPYILHPLEAVVIAGSLTGDEEVLAAAALHDVVEDAGVAPGEIEKIFGKRVLSLVLSETEDKRPERPPEDTWMIRKKESLRVLSETGDEGVKILWLADKLSNIRSFYAGVRAEGDSYFDRFHQKDKKLHEWYYREIAGSLRSLEDTCAYQEYVSLIDRVFGRPENR